MRPAIRTLTIEARHLDTDERTVASFDVEMPGDAAGQRKQLVELVSARHPQARLRSFGDGAASFLDAEHLVVAHYVTHDSSSAEADKRAERSIEAQYHQQALFAA